MCGVNAAGGATRARAPQPAELVGALAFLPGSRRATWPEARKILSAASKPVIVAALVEPGAVALWNLDDFDSAERDALERELSNQRVYFTEKLRLLGLGDADSIVLETPAGLFRITVAVFKQWVSEYAISVGITVASSSDAHTGRIHLRPPGGGRPLGLGSDDISPAS